jgi:hypothetical protein
MGAGPSSQHGGRRRVRLNVASLEECLNEGEALAQGRRGDVPTIFAAVLRQRGDQVFGDEFQLRVRVFGAKVRQLLQTGVAQTGRVGQERHTRRGRRWDLFRRRQRPRSCLALPCVEEALDLSHRDFGGDPEQMRIIVDQPGSLAANEQAAP